MARRVLSLLLALGMLSACSGCTLIGLGVGSAIPKKTTYGAREPIGPALDQAIADAEVAVGDHMDITTRPSPALPPEPPAPEIGPPIAVQVPRVVSGRLHSIDPHILRVDGDDYFAEIPRERIETVRVSHGSLWLPMMLMGLAFDTAAASLSLWAILSMKDGFR